MQRFEEDSDRSEALLVSQQNDYHGQLHFPTNTSFPGQQTQEAASYAVILSCIVTADTQKPDVVKTIFTYSGRSIDLGVARMLVSGRWTT
jgi:hypothetical protein